MRNFEVRRVLLTAALVAGLAGLAGCGGGSFSCTDKSKCSNDSASTQTEINQCNAALAGPCGSQYKTGAACAESHQKCDSSGHTDDNATAAQCDAQIAAIVNCCQSHQGAAGC